MKTSKTTQANLTSVLSAQGGTGTRKLNRFDIHSLSTRLIGIFCLILILAIGATTAIHYHNMKTSLIAAMDSKAQSKLNTLAPLCATYFSNFEMDLVAQLGRSVQDEDEIGFVVITEEEGQEYFRDNETAQRDEVRVYERGIVADDALLGKIQIGLDSSALKIELQKILLYSFVIGMIAVLTGVVVSLFLSRSITRPLVRMSRMLEDIAQGAGDLTQRLDDSEKNELGNLAYWFNIFVSRLQTIITQAGGSTNHLASEIERVAENAKESRRAAEQQQTMIAKAVTAIDEMVCTVREIASDAAETAQSANATQSEAKQGQSMVSSTKQAIGVLAEEIENASEIITMLGDECDSIGGILTLIKAIADQTNLLALNASIEAARAGEQGRGFAVVADEVRTLASRTQHATQDIGEVIERLQTGAHQAMAAMEEGRNQAEKSVQRASDASQYLTSVTDAAQDISDRSRHIANATEEQLRVTGGINHNMASIDEICINTSQVAQLTATASEALSHLAVELQRLMAQFRV